MLTTTLNPKDSPKSLYYRHKLTLNLIVRRRDTIHTTWQQPITHSTLNNPICTKCNLLK